MYSGFAEDCLDPMCSGHGVCVQGECHCSTGWGGVNCETSLPVCQEQCSGHGTFLLDTGLCSCEPQWTGPDCSTGMLKDVILSIMPVLSVWAMKKSSYYYYASMFLKSKLGMNRACCGTALNGLVSNWLSVDRDREAFSQWQDCWLTVWQQEHQSCRNAGFSWHRLKLSMAFTHDVEHLSGSCNEGIHNS